MKNIVKWKEEDNSIAVTGKVYYLNTVTGSDSNSGLRTTEAFLTSAYAESVMENGDVLLDVATGSGGSYAELPIVRKISQYYAYKMNDTIYDNDLYSFTLETRESVIAMATGSTYYLDFDNGNDTTGNGSTGSPWKTIAKSQSSCPEGSLILMRNGTYGAMTDATYTGSRTNPTVYMNDVGHSPVITSLNCSAAHDYNLRLVFYGIQIAPAWVDPGATDPMYAESTQSTYNKTAVPVYISHANYFNFYNCELVGTNKYLTADSIYLTYANYITVQRCEIHDIAEGPTYLYSSNLKFEYNYIHDLCASGIKDGTTGSSYITVEGNHISNLYYTLTDPYCPKATGANYHGSIIAMNNGTYTIRNNILHWGGPTNPICFYTGGNPIYNDVLIENNIIYNPSATIAITMDLVGENIIVRNNLIIGQKRDPVETGDYRYNIAIYLWDFASGYDGTDVHIYNNIFIGMSIVSPSTTNMDIDYNIVYQGSDFNTVHSIEARVDKTATYFESNFFNGTLNLRNPEADSILDLTLADGCDAINYGLSSYQPTDSLGSFDENNEFIIPNGIARDSSHHDAGAYQK